MVKCPFCHSDVADNECPSCGSLEGVDLEEFAPKDKETPGANSKTSFIFLDIDGVLNTANSRPETLEISLVTNFVRLINTTRASIVLSSTWRVHQRLVEKVRQTLWLAGAQAEIECTPILNWDTWGELKGEHDVCQARCEEIATWLKDNAPRVKLWVALDDLALCSQNPELFQGRHVQTDAHVGLTPSQVAEAVTILCPS